MPYPGQHRLFTGTTDQTLDIGPDSHPRFSDQLDTVFSNSRNGRCVDNFRVYRHLHGFEYVTTCKVDSGSHLER